jgi:hypothetical protein
MDHPNSARPGAVPVEGLTVDGTSVPPPASSNVISSDVTPEAGHGLPRVVRRPLAAARVQLRRPTARLRTRPDFLILGAQRSGTTSLYRYLAEHPAVAPPVRKEIQYFTLHHRRGEGWYRAHFPVGGRNRLTFEATPYYLFHPGAPGRAAATVPDAKLIAMLRDPVTRAFSHWQHNASRGLETLGFEAALDAEASRLAGEGERLAVDAAYRSDAHRLWSYTARGEYAVQLQRWLAAFPRDQLLVVRSEDLYERPGATYTRVLDFLGLPHKTLDSYPRYTRRTSTSEMSDAARRRLRAHFRPHNERLASLIGQDLGWDDA